MPCLAAAQQGTGVIVAPSTDESAGSQAAGIMVGGTIGAQPAMGYAVAANTSAFSGLVPNMVAPMGPPRAIPETPGESPGAHMAWVPGFWTWTGAQYAWTRGMWRQVPQGRTSWVPGRWQQTPRGWMMTVGAWR